MKYILILIILAFISCRLVVQKIPTPPIELQEYITEFEEYYNVKITYEVKFENLEEGIAGVCRIWRRGKK